MANVFKAKNADTNKWAKAVAERIADEWDGAGEFPEDAKLLKAVLTKAFKKVPDELLKLIGTGIIEEDYFENLP